MSKVDDFFNTKGIATPKSSSGGNKFENFFATAPTNTTRVDETIGGRTYISQAPERTEKKWPLGFVGEAAKAAYTTAKDTIESAAGKIDDFLGTITAEDRAKNPHGEDYTKVTGQTIGMTPEQRKQYYEGKKKEGATINKVAKAGEATLGIANIAFLPVTAQIEGAKKVPILKYPAEAASFIFEKLGEAGEYAMGKAVDNAPISEENKEIIRPFSQQLGAFVTQLAGIKAGFKVSETGGKRIVEKLPVSEKTKGKIETGVKAGVGLSMTPFTTAYGLASAKISQKINERKEAGIEITPEESKKIIEEIKAELPEEIKKEEALEKTTTESKKGSEALFNKPQDVRTVMENLSNRFNPDKVVDIMKDLYEKNPSGKFTPREVVDSIEKTGANAVFKMEEVPAQEIPFNASGYTKPAQNAPVERFKVAEIAPKTEGADKADITIKKVEKTTPEAPIASSPKPIDVKAEEQLTSRVFERMKAEHPLNIPELGKDLGYDPVKLKEDAARAVNLIAKDKQKAFDIAMGKETSTEVTSTAVNIALAEKALQEKNYDLYAKLIKNRSLEQTRRGQELVAEKGSITDNSTSKYVKELIASRLESLGKRYLSDLKNTLGKTTDKSNATRIIEREVAKVEKQIKNKKLDTKTALSLLDKLTCV